MAEASAPGKYSGLAIAIHWIVALCVIGLVPAGLLVAHLEEGPAQARLSAIHQSVGLLVLALMIVRLGLRAAGRMPAPATVLTPFERTASQVAHFSLCALLVLAPIVGWLGVNAYGEDVSFFGLFKLPNLIGRNEDLSDSIFAVHFACAILIGLVSLAHIVAAFVHKMRDDGVMERILPGR